MENKILIVDDDIKLVELFKKCVTKDSLEADVCCTSEEGRLSECSTSILDVMEVI